MSDEIAAELAQACADRGETPRRSYPAEPRALTSIAILAINLRARKVRNRKHSAMERVIDDR